MRSAVLVLTLLLAGCGAPAAESLFSRHMKTCPACRASFAESPDEPICEEGFRLLQQDLREGRNL